MKLKKHKAYNLFKLLKLKKKLETAYFNDKPITFKENLKNKIKGTLLTQNPLFFFTRHPNKSIKLLENSIHKYKTLKSDGKTICIPSIKKNRLQYPFYHKLIAYNKALLKHDSHLIVQGSYADETNISYSDLDLVIIGHLKKEVKEIKKEIERFLLEIDPIQHHGVFFINKNSLSDYWLMDLPIQTLEKARYFSETDLKLVIKSYFIEKYSSCYWLRNFINYYKTFPLQLDYEVFLAKYFISQLLLVPTLVLAYKGEYVYKKDSFTKAQKYYSDEAWKCIKMTEKLRKKWNQDKINEKYRKTRNNAVEKNNYNYSTLQEVVQVDNKYLLQLERYYYIFLAETNIIINKK